MHNIAYFDAHCDTIYRCVEDATGLSMFDDYEEQKAYYDLTDNIRQNGGHIDLKRGREYAKYAQFFALFADSKYTDDLWARCNLLHERFLKEMAENADWVTHCRTGAEVDEAVAAGKCASLLSIEGADLLECRADRLETVRGWGVRLMNLVWNRANAISGTMKEDADRGLSAHGCDFVREMERCGIYADVSHLSDEGFWDLFRVARRSIVASHSNSRAVCDHPRNLTDDMFRAIRDSGGVVGINLYRDFVGDDSMDTLVRHVEHFLDLGGEKTVCIGGDLDGCEVLAAGMGGVEDVGELYRALERRGYGEALLNDIFWNNLRRLL